MIIQFEIFKPHKYFNYKKHKKIKPIIYVLIISAFFLFYCKSEKKIDYEVTSQQIYKEFQDNEVAATSKYKDKRIRVTGTLISFDRTLGTNYCYIGSPGDFIGEVSCAMSEEFSKQAGNYTKGQTISLEGKCIGRSFTGVVNLE